MTLNHLRMFSCEKVYTGTRPAPPSIFTKSIQSNYIEAIRQTIGNTICEPNKAFLLFVAEILDTAPLTHRHPAVDLESRHIQPYRMSHTTYPRLKIHPDQNTQNHVHTHLLCRPVNLNPKYSNRTLTRMILL